MTFEAPIQPVPVRRGRIAAVVVGISITAGILVWAPWSTPSATAPSVPAAPAVADATGSPVPHPPATPTPSPTPYVPPVGALQRTYLPFIRTPTLDLFRPRWSVVGLRDEANSALAVTQIPVVTTTGFIEGTPADAICRVGVFGSSFVAALPARTFRQIGIAAPAGELSSAVQLTRVDGSLVSDYELLVAPPADGSSPRASARVFVQSDLERWPGGTYRFHLEAPDGTPRFAYACLVPPSLLDAMDFARSGP
jgi:hypothetical protein